MTCNATSQPSLQHTLHTHSIHNIWLMTIGQLQEVWGELYVTQIFFKRLVYFLIAQLYCEKFFLVSSVSTKCVEIETLLRPIISFSPVSTDWTREEGDSWALRPCMEDRARALARAIALL